MVSVIQSPSVFEYKELYAQYPLTIQCRCTHIAIKCQQFISQLQPTYHEICSSVFISSEWREVLRHIAQIISGYAFGEDYRNNIAFQFEVVSILCNLSLTSFEQTDFFTRQVLSPTEFQVQTDTLFNQFKNTIADDFMQTLELILLINEGNQLATCSSRSIDSIQYYF
ncbi:unnamed protein product [Adineta ricciae]|uniref:Uncharacterized protein n=1 Tax=Adineta ricciae TaxID=249248 RepID=A0A814JKS9_ADIRI|nr:unnamed protein product [Adineta ricciae]CAF1375100.1 unnamed protein product [Adineta ricciae]